MGVLQRSSKFISQRSTNTILTISTICMVTPAQMALCKVDHACNLEPMAHPSKGGGHMIFKELHLLFITFSLGFTVLLPFALLTHLNLAMGEGKMRYLFTQYTAGSLFSYVHNRMKFNKDVDKKSMLDSEGLASSTTLS